MTEDPDSLVVRFNHIDAPGIVTLRFNRPQVKNALDPATMLLANRHLVDCQYDRDVRAIFLTGTDDAFCSGVDLKFMNALPPEDRAAALEPAMELMTRIVSMPKIVVAALNGASAGLGNHLVLCCDLSIAKRGAALHFTGPAKGIPSMQFGALLLPMIIGLKRAKWLLLRGGRVTAEEAGNTRHLQRGDRARSMGTRSLLRLRRSSRSATRWRWRTISSS